MKRNSLYALIGTFAVLITAFTFTNAQEREKRNVDSFTRISFQTSGTLYLTQGNTQKVELVGSDDKLRKIETVVKGDKLIIRREGNGWKNWSSSGKLDIYITVKNIEGISVGGSGRVMGQNKFKTDDLRLSVSGAGKMELEVDAADVDFSISGSGRITISGNADNNDISISGSGKIDGEEFSCKAIDASISGSGSCRVNVSDRIDARISGSGSIYYKGNPSHVNASSSGSGKVKKI
ncbi:MAG: head GIN domain-containing protein [Bacteroidota bacterium]